MGKGKPRHDPNKPQHHSNGWCGWAEDIPGHPTKDGSVYIYCEHGYDATFCKGNPHLCKKAWYRSLARRSDRRKQIDNGD